MTSLFIGMTIGLTGVVPWGQPLTPGSGHLGTATHLHYS